jgi:hypothetical protein
MAYTDGPRGVGGWLAFFLLTLAVFGPLLEIAGIVAQLTNPDIARAYGTRWPAVRTSAVALSAAGILIGWFIVGRFLLVRNWRTVRIGVAGLWLLCALSILVAPLLVSLFGNIPFQALVSQMIPALVRPILYSAIWTAYLLRSRRVANTYGDPDADQAELARVFR